MAKNMIQFQKGLSLPEFLSVYGTDEQCRKALFRMRWPDGFVCPDCGHTAYCELITRKVFQCYTCPEPDIFDQWNDFRGYQADVVLLVSRDLFYHTV